MAITKKNEKPAWLKNAEARDAAGTTVLSKPNTGPTGTGGTSYTAGNYQIGSQKGQQIANDLGIGQTYYNPNDGSTWYKNNDGSVTVDHNGTRTQNAYKMTDLGTLGQQQMAAGLDHTYLTPTYYGRQNKAMYTPGLKQYANDPIQQSMWQYILNSQQQSNQQAAQDMYNQWLQEYGQNNPQPTAPQKDPRIDQYLNQILNRDEFNYNALDDPLYQQYAEMYRREGDRAMRNTMAEAAAGAGGMNSYAMTAAMQANNYYNSQLNDKIPELYQLAYDKYLKNIDLQIQDLGILQDMDQTQYNRYRDTMNDWRDDKKFAYGVYQDAVNQGNYQNDFEYGSMWDNINFNNNNYWKNKDYTDNRADIEYERNKEDEASAKDIIYVAIEAGETSIDPELIAKAGMTQDEVNLLITAWQAKNAPKGKVGKVASGGGDGNPIYDPQGDPADNPQGNGDGSVTGLKIGPVSDDLLERLAVAGAIVGDENGNLYWADGWNASNYKTRLNAALGGVNSSLALPML